MLCGYFKKAMLIHRPWDSTYGFFDLVFRWIYHRGVI